MTVNDKLSSIRYCSFRDLVDYYGGATCLLSELLCFLTSIRWVHHWILGNSARFVSMGTRLTETFWLIFSAFDRYSRDCALS